MEGRERRARAESRPVYPQQASSTYLPYSVVRAQSTTRKSKNCLRNAYPCLF